MERIPKKLVYTLGHSVYEYETFFDILTYYAINCIVDVRRSPYSYAQQYNKESFAVECKRRNYTYMYMGDVLGHIAFGKYLVSGFVQYSLRMQEDDFQNAIQRIVLGVTKGYTITLLCAEKEPLQCHRHLLLAQALTQKGIAVAHILDKKTLCYAATVPFQQKNLFETLLQC